jgi:hypothetical protein
MGICLLVWCLGHGVASAERITFTNDIRDQSRSERIFAYEFGSIVGGLVTQTTASDAVFAGVLPLQINLGGGRLVVEAGAVVASDNVPAAGTHANFMARAQLRVTKRVAIAYWHWSNGELGKRNPAVDSVGVTVQLRPAHRIRGLRPQ